jgi:hypothetical protein
VRIKKVEALGMLASSCMVLCGMGAFSLMFLDPAGLAAHPVQSDKAVLQAIDRLDLDVVGGRARPAEVRASLRALKSLTTYYVDPTESKEDPALSLSILRKELESFE